MKEISHVRNNLRETLALACRRGASATVIVFAALLVPVLALAQSFNPTGKLNVGRNGHRAIALNNGTVLVAGGYDFNENALATCELYDLLTGTFSTTGSLNLPRRNFGITLLDNGTVLISGGYDASFNALSSAEIYDPATGAFTFTGSLNVARADATATRLSDGTVLIAGGFDTSNNALSSAEIYVPSTGTFTLTGSLNTARGFATATALIDGTVLIAGGWASSALSGAEIYDPTTGVFKVAGSMNQARVRGTSTLLNGGTVLVAGGEDGASNTLSGAEIYSPGTGAFAPTGNLNTARGDHAATLLTNGTVLVEGGFTCDPSDCAATTVDMSATAEIYDPSSGLFTSTANLATARQVHTATLLPNGIVLVAGGFSDANPGLTAAELYQPISSTPANLSAITIGPSNPSLLVGTVQGLLAIGTFSDNTTQPLTSVIWSSSDTTVAAVTNDSGSNSGMTNDSTNSGVVFAMAPGTAILTACAGTICGSTTVTVSSSGFAVSASPTSRYIRRGGTATFSLVLTPAAHFSGNVALSCIGNVPGVHCSVSPSTLTLKSSSATAAVTISTAAATVASMSSGPNNFEKTEPERGFDNTRGGIAGTTLIFPLGLILLRAMTYRKRRARLALLALILAFEFVACGGGTPDAMSAANTPSGNYTMTITATSGHISRSAQLTIIVR